MSEVKRGCYAMDRRRERINECLEYIKNKKEINLHEFIGIMCHKFGVRKKIIVEYLNILEDSGKIAVLCNDGGYTTIKYIENPDTSKDTLENKKGE